MGRARVWAEGKAKKLCVGEGGVVSMGENRRGAGSVLGEGVRNAGPNLVKNPRLAEVVIGHTHPGSGGGGGRRG